MPRRTTPVSPPFLRPMDNDNPKATRRNKGITPKQTTLSVQDVPRYDTPQGAAQANEEMRRLRLGIQDIAAQIQQGGTGGDGGGRTPMTTTGGGGGGGGEEPECCPQSGFTVQHHNRFGEVIDVDYPKRIDVLHINDWPLFYSEPPIIVAIEWTMSGVKDEAKYNTLESGAGMTAHLTASGYVLKEHIRELIPGVIRGSVKINNLYRTPLPGEVIPDDMLFAYSVNGRNHIPANGQYGWAVWNIITHNLNLYDKDDFIINLTDVQLVDDPLENPGGLPVLPPLTRPQSEEPRVAEQIYNVAARGLDANRILITGVYKPDIDYKYVGTNHIPVLDYQDEAQRIIRTNLIYRYIIYGGK